MNVAIIPARGGSKRIPRKNIKQFCGKPIIAHSIETAIKSKLFQKIFVTTDDAEIAHIAMKYGAEVPFLRCKDLSDDHTGTHEVIGDAVKRITDLGFDIEYACCIYPTAPLIIPSDLIKGFELVREGNWDTVFAATNFSYPIMRSFKLNNGGGLEMFFPENFEKRSQDLAEAFHDAGQFYWAHASVWAGKNPGFGRTSTIVPLPNWRVQDIDNIDDWKRAEYIFQSLQLQK